MENTQSDTKKTIFSWAMIHNLQLIIDFHNLLHQMMKNQILKINENIVSCNDKSEKKELLLQKSNYINTYDNLLKVNIFLMMYAHLEEFLLLIKKSFDNNQTITDSGSLLRFQPIIKNTLNFDLSKDREWEQLSDFEKIRDCILHANGRVSISKKKDEIERIIKKSKGKLSINMDRIKLSGEFLITVSDTIESIIQRIDSIKKT